MKFKNLLIASLAASAITSAGAQSAATDVPQSDLNAFQSFLNASDAAGQWDGPPKRIDSDAIRAAYPDQRFYFTWKAKPVPPGAKLPEPLRQHGKAMEEYQKHSLQVTLRAGAGGSMQPFRTPAEFNSGLMQVTNAKEAATAAAAIMSLLSEAGMSPVPIAVADVKVSASADGGWTCRYDRPRAFTATVNFDRTGHCVSASKSLNYNPPVPM